MNDASKAYYEAHDSSSSQSTYPSLAYVDTRAPQSTHHQPVTYQPDQAPLFYTAANASTDDPTGVASQSDPLVSYGQPLEHQTPDLMWRTSWQNWTAAIADSQARYSANALLTLGGGGGNAGGGAGRSSVVAPIMSDNSLTAMSHTGEELPMMPQPAQWPLIMFDPTPQQ